MENANEPPFQNAFRQVNKIMDQLNKAPYFSYCSNETWAPAVNLYENDTDYLVCVDLAGVEKDKIDIEVQSGQLTLRGNRAVPVYPEKTGDELSVRRVRVHLMEIDHGSFCRQVELPVDAATEQISASYRNGLLWIEIPKQPGAPPSLAP